MRQTMYYNRKPWFLRCDVDHQDGRREWHAGRAKESFIRAFWCLVERKRDIQLAGIICDVVEYLAANTTVIQGLLV